MAFQSDHHDWEFSLFVELSSVIRFFFHFDQVRDPARSK